MKTTYIVMMLAITGILHFGRSAIQQNHSNLFATDSPLIYNDTLPEILTRIDSVRKVAEKTLRRQMDSILRQAGFAIRRAEESIKKNTDLLIKQIADGEDVNTVLINEPVKSSEPVPANTSPVKTEPTVSQQTVSTIIEEVVEKGETINFTSAGNALTGYLYKPLIPKKPSYPLIVVLHASEEGSHDYRLYTQFVEDMNKIGYAVFTYDRRGSGMSAGSFESASFSDLALDAASAIDILKLRNDVDTSKIGLFGLSQGAWIAGILNALRDDIDFNIMVSASTMSPIDQMNYAAFTNLTDKQFSKLEIDSALRVRSVVDDYYHGKLTYEQANPFVKNARNSRWFKDALIFDLAQEKEKSKWFKQMDFDPLTFLKAIKKPTLVIYGEQDREVSIDKGVYDWKQLKTPKLEIKRVNLAGHFMIEFEKDNPANPVISGIYRNYLESWVKKQ